MLFRLSVRSTPAMSSTNSDSLVPGPSSSSTGDGHWTKRPPKRWSRRVAPSTRPGSTHWTRPKRSPAARNTEHRRGTAGRSTSFVPFAWREIGTIESSRTGESSGWSTGGASCERGVNYNNSSTQQAKIALWNWDRLVATLSDYDRWLSIDEFIEQERLASELSNRLATLANQTSDTRLLSLVDSD